MLINTAEKFTIQMIVHLNIFCIGKITVSTKIKALRMNYRSTTEPLIGIATLIIQMENQVPSYISLNDNDNFTCKHPKLYTTLYQAEIGKLECGKIVAVNGPKLKKRQH